MCTRIIDLIENSTEAYFVDCYPNDQELGEVIRYFWQTKGIQAPMELSNDCTLGNHIRVNVIRLKNRFK